MSGGEKEAQEVERLQRVTDHRELLKLQHEEMLAAKARKKEEVKLQDIADKERVERELAQMVHLFSLFLPSVLVTNIPSNQG